MTEASRGNKVRKPQVFAPYTARCMSCTKSVLVIQISVGMASFVVCADCQLLLIDACGMARHTLLTYE